MREKAQMNSQYYEVQMSEEVKTLQYERESSGYKKNKQVKARTAVRKG
jgi:hypothetical protein